MVAVPFDPQVTSTQAMEVTLTMSQERTRTRTLDAAVTAVGWRGLILNGGGLEALWDGARHSELPSSEDATCGSDEPVCVGGPAELDCEGCPEPQEGEANADTHAWVDLALPGGLRIRPLVKLSQRIEGGVTARFVHLFPRDRLTLEAYHATRSASY